MADGEVVALAGWNPAIRQSGTLRYGGAGLMKAIIQFGIVLLLGGMASAATPARWWMEEPVRLVQTNIREIDSTLDAQRLVKQVADYPANTLLFNMGGIVAQYPTRVEFHYASAYLPAGRDLFGDVLKEAHARGIRVIGRFDLSKAQKPVFDAHPEWFFKQVNEEPSIYNGLYSACINGDYYRAQALKILTEALERYPVDGLFFNMFGNPAADYSGRPLGPCQCAECQRKFQAHYGRPLPTTSNDPDYVEFMADSAREVAAGIAELIHRLRPQAAFLTYLESETDVIMSEANTSVTRALPMWPYSASDNVNRARNSEPDKMAINLCMGFVDFPWRFVTVSSDEIRLRLWEAMANGGPPALGLVGTMDQEDRQALLAGGPVFKWHAQHADLYAGEQSAARVLLLGGKQDSYRGFFRLLSEQHVPFAVSDNLKWLDDPARKFDLVIAPGRVPAGLERYAREGGRVLLAGASAPPPEFQLGTPLGVRARVQGIAWRIQDHAAAAVVEKHADLLFLDGDYVEFAPMEKPLLTLIPPAMFGPPEKVWVDKVETRVPGLLFADTGKGRVADIPWDVGGLYYRQSSPGHAGLMADVIDALLPHGRQLRTGAHPLVEITVMQQSKPKRTLLHFVNLSGHSDTAYFAPVEMRDIAVEFAGEFRRAKAVGLDKDLRVTRAGDRGRFTLPLLKGYEVVMLE